MTADAGSPSPAPVPGGTEEGAAAPGSVEPPLGLPARGTPTPGERSEQPGALDRRARSRPGALQTMLSPGRDFGVPALLLLALATYLLFQRRLDRGALPMTAATEAADGEDRHVRYEL